MEFTNFGGRIREENLRPQETFNVITGHK